MMLKFRFLLWAFGLIMRTHARKKGDFYQHLQGKDFVFQLQTEDQSICRHYQIAGGTVKSNSGAHSDPALTISFRSAEQGVANIVAMKKDKNALMKAIQNKDILVSGDLSLVMWLMAASKHLKPRKK